MSSLYVRGTWFERMAPHVLYESEYEQIVEQHAGTLFEDFRLIPFKTRVESEVGVVEPDLCLVGVDYSQWVVIEVELATHSFGGHVEPQVLKMLLGDYNRRHAKRIADSDPSLDEDSLIDMMKGEQPRVLVIVNAEVPDWEEKLRAHGAEVLIFEPYISELNQFAFHVDGTIPSIVSDHISACQRSTIPNMLEVDRPGALPVEDGETFRVRYGDGVTVWKRVDGKRAVWLTPHGNFPLSGDGPYMLVREGDSLNFEHGS